MGPPQDRNHPVFDPSLSTQVLRKGIVKSHMGRVVAFERRHPSSGCVNVPFINRLRENGGSAVESMDATGVLCATQPYAKMAANVITGTRGLITLGTAIRRTPDDQPPPMSQTPGAPPGALRAGIYSQFGKRTGAPASDMDFQQQRIMRAKAVLPYETRASRLEARRVAFRKTRPSM